MAVVRPFVFQVVGFQNSGKTTLSEAIIQQLNNAGLQVSAIKHHGHGGKPAIYQKKDSARHINAGAVSSIVEGDGRLLLHAEKDAWTLEQQIDIMGVFKPDTILIEGHKSASYPKFVLVRNGQDYNLLHELKNILAVVYWEEETDGYRGVPAFSIKSSRTANELVKIILREMGMD
jgi:molybdopterin-guanine dinucleotide biosynthesis adapter protein